MRTQIVYGTQHGHQPPLDKVRSLLACARYPFTQTGQNRYLDLAPHSTSIVLTAMRAERYHHPIGSDEQRQRSHRCFYPLLAGLLIILQRLQLLLEPIQRCLPCCLNPFVERCARFANSSSTSLTASSRASRQAANISAPTEGAFSTALISSCHLLPS